MKAQHCLEHRQQTVAVTTQEAVDRCRERTSRIGQHHGCQSRVKTIEPLGETVAEQSRWMEREESQSLDSCQALAREDSRQHVGRDNQGR